VTPVEDPRLKKYLKEDVLDVYLRDNTNARELLPDGSYVRVCVDEAGEPFDSQMYFEGVDPNI
jgi:polyphosphate kinase